MSAALITGGAKRVGREIALALADAGYDIALHTHTSDASATQADVRARGVKCELFTADLQDTKALPALVTQAKSAFPALNVLINNAAVFERSDFLSTDEALFDRQFNTNFKAPFFLTQAFAKQVEGGHIISLLDTDIANTHGSHFAYLLSKKTLAEFTRMAARALGPKFQVNGVAPGIVLPSSDLDEDYMQRLKQRVPLTELATPESIAKAVAGLLHMPHITGQILFVDGGQHLL